MSCPHKMWKYPLQVEEKGPELQKKGAPETLDMEVDPIPMEHEQAEEAGEEEEEDGEESNPDSCSQRETDPPHTHFEPPEITQDSLLKEWRSWTLLQKIRVAAKCFTFERNNSVNICETFRFPPTCNECKARKQEYLRNFYRRMSREIVTNGAWAQELLDDAVAHTNRLLGLDPSLPKE